MSNTITWTIAFRNPRANRFRRVTNWNGTWDQASELARAYVTLYPQLQVWVTTTKEAEDAGYTVEEDRGTIMVESGRRVKVIDNAELTAAELAKLQVITFERIGREAALADEPAAPSVNAKVQAALEGRTVGDPVNVRVMEAFSRGYDAVRDEQAQAVLAEPVEAPAAPQPRYVAVKSDSQSFPFMVHDNRRNQTVPGSSVTNMEAAVQHAARLNALPHYYAGIEHGTMAWCVQENRVGGPRCSTRWFGDDAQAQAEAKALEMNQEEGLLLPEPVIEEDHYPLTALEMEIETDAIEAAERTGIVDDRPDETTVEFEVAITPVLVWADGTVTTGYTELADRLKGIYYGHEVENFTLYVTQGGGLEKATARQLSSHTDEDDWMDVQIGVFAGDATAPVITIGLRIDGRA